MVRCYPPPMQKQFEDFAARMSTRFRGFLPVVVDVETGGFDAERTAALFCTIVNRWRHFEELERDTVGID